jgi:hypothetical protein
MANGKSLIGNTKWQIELANQPLQHQQIELAK